MSDKKILAIQFPGLGIPLGPPIAVGSGDYFGGALCTDEEVWSAADVTKYPRLSKGFTRVTLSDSPDWDTLQEGVWFDWYVAHEELTARKWGTGIIVRRSEPEGGSGIEVTWKLQNYTGWGFDVWSAEGAEFPVGATMYFLPFLPRMLTTATPKEYLTNLGVPKEKWRDIADNCIESFGQTLTQDVDVSGGLASTGGFPFSVLHDGHNPDPSTIFLKSRQHTNLVETLLGDNAAMVGALDDSVLDNNKPAKWTRSSEGSAWPVYSFKSQGFRIDSEGIEQGLLPMVDPADWETHWDFHLGNSCTLRTLWTQFSPEFDADNPYVKTPDMAYGVAEWCYGGELVDLKNTGHASYLPPTGIGRLINVYMIEDQPNPWIRPNINPVFRGYVDEYQSEVGEGLVTIQTVDALQIFKQSRNLPNYIAEGREGEGGEEDYSPIRPAEDDDCHFENAVRLRFKEEFATEDSDTLDTQWIYMDGWFFPRQDLVRTEGEGGYWNGSYDFWPREGDGWAHYVLTAAWTKPIRWINAWKVLVEEDSDYNPDIEGGQTYAWQWQILKTGIPGGDDGLDEWRVEPVLGYLEASDKGLPILTLFNDRVRGEGRRQLRTWMDKDGGTQHYLTNMGDDKPLITTGYLGLPSFPARNDASPLRPQYLMDYDGTGNLGRTRSKNKVARSEVVGRFQFAAHAYTLFGHHLNPKEIEPAHVFSSSRVDNPMKDHNLELATVFENGERLRSLFRESCASVSDVILQVLTSTGTYSEPETRSDTIMAGVGCPRHGVNGPHDIIPKVFGMSVPISNIDLESLEHTVVYDPSSGIYTNLDNIFVRNLYMRLSDSNDIAGWLEKNLLKPYGLILMIANGKIRIVVADSLPREARNPSFPDAGELIPLEMAVTTSDLSGGRLSDVPPTNHKKSVNELITSVDLEYVDSSVRWYGETSRPGVLNEWSVREFEDMRVSLVAASPFQTPERTVAPNADHVLSLRPTGLPAVGAGTRAKYPKWHYLRADIRGSTFLKRRLANGAKIGKAVRDNKITRWGRGKPLLNMTISPTYRYIDYVTAGATIPVALKNVINFRGGKDVVGYLWIVSVVDDIMTGEKTIDGYLVAEGVPVQNETPSHSLWSIYGNVVDDRADLQRDQVRLESRDRELSWMNFRNFHPPWLMRALDEYDRELARIIVTDISPDPDPARANEWILTVSNLSSTLSANIKRAILAPLNTQIDRSVVIDNSFTDTPYTWN